MCLLISRLFPRPFFSSFRFNNNPTIPRTTEMMIVQHGRASNNEQQQHTFK